MLKESSAFDLLSPVSDEVNPSRSSFVSSYIKLARTFNSSWLVTRFAKVFGGPGSETVFTNCSASSINLANSSFASW